MITNDFICMTNAQCLKLVAACGGTARLRGKTVEHVRKRVAQIGRRYLRQCGEAAK